MLIFSRRKVKLAEGSGLPKVSELAQGRAEIHTQPDSRTVVFPVHHTIAGLNSS